MEPNRSPIGWALLPLKRYAEFGGRSPRAEFWWFFLFMMVVYLAMWFVAVGAIGGMAAAQSEPSMGMIGAFGAAGLFMILFWLALLIPTIAVQVRRLHDLNRSGWWIGGFYLLYAIYMAVLLGVLGAGIAAGMEGSPDPTPGTSALFAGTGILALVMMAYGIVLLVFYCLPGTKGANRYGADPYGEDVADVFA
jgi:uncharacterized membrane protein YhaH (DUF805 family)